MNKNIIVGLVLSLVMSAPVSTYAITHAEWLAQIDAPVQTEATSTPVVVKPVTQSAIAAPNQDAQIAQLQAIIVLLTELLRQLRIKNGLAA